MALNIAGKARVVHIHFPGAMHEPLANTRCNNNPEAVN
jgi:hypothetical protein